MKKEIMEIKTFGNSIVTTLLAAEVLGYPETIMDYFAKKVKSELKTDILDGTISIIYNKK